MKIIKPTIVILGVFFVQSLLAEESRENVHSQKKVAEIQMKTEEQLHGEGEKVYSKMLMGMDEKEIVKGARDPFANSGGYEYRGIDGWEETDEIAVSKIIFDQLEYRDNNDASLSRWDMQGWYGTDYKKLWIKFEGEDESSRSSGEFSLETLYSKATASYWDLQYGARYDRAYGSDASNERYFGVLGLQGLAPYWFEIESSLYIDQDANLSGRLIASYDLLLNQRLILQPRFELNVSANDLPQFNIGKGINDVQFDLRLRYEFKREIAPYLGITWQKKYGDTEAYTLNEGGSSEFTELVLGIRIWF